MSRNKLTIIAVLVALMLGTVSNTLAQATLVVWADDTRAPILQEFSAQVEADLGITLDVVQLGLGDIRDQLLVAGPAGEGPDLLISVSDTVGQLVTNGAILPIELGDKAESFSEGGLNLFTFNDQLWGVPYAIENIALIRNTDLVPEAPATWQEVRTITEQLQADGTAEYGLALQTGNTYHNYPITSAFGGYIFGQDESGAYNPADIGLNSEGGIASAEWLSGMYTDELMPLSVNDDVAFQLWEDQEAAMIVTGPWFSTRIIDAASDGGFNYSIDPLPGAEGVSEVGSPFSGGQGFMISAFSENQLLAEIFLLDYVATPEFMQALFDADPRPPVFAGVDTSSDPNLGGFQAAGASAQPIPAIPEMNAVWAASDAALTLISQGQDPVESYNTAASQILTNIEVQASGAVNSVTIAGSLQDELGCENEWDPACEATFLEDQGDGIWVATFSVPAGDYEYKAALNADWAESYGLDGGDGNVVLSLAEDTDVTFTYDHNTNIVTDSVNTPES